MANDNDLILELTDLNFDSEISKSPLPVLVDFWAPWCGPCKMIAPLIAEIARETQGRVQVGKVNVDDNPATASQFRIQAIPTLLIFKNGQKIDQITGLVSKADLLAKLG